jgi:fructose-1,6-bisphosphatase I
MTETLTLKMYLDRWSRAEAARANVASTVLGLAGACAGISKLVARGPLAGALGAPTGKKSGVDPQKEIDIIANDLIVAAMQKAPVATLASEELDAPLLMNPGAPLAVAVDPIDGSSNVDANVSIGTIFTVLPASAGGNDASSFLQPGTQQLAAGFCVYGPFTSLVLTVGVGTQIFTLDADTNEFIRTAHSVLIPPVTSEYAINGSNYRHWEEHLRIYADDLLRGRDGPRGKDFNMRWTASPVSDIYRILTRGGIFLYPGDLRDGYAMGRLRLVYEANPLAWVIEQAGGGASNGQKRIMDLIPRDVHQRTPIIAGSRAEVDYVVRLGQEPHGAGEKSPLFSRRGLFRS